MSVLTGGPGKLELDRARLGVGELAGEPSGGIASDDGHDPPAARDPDRTVGREPVIERVAVEPTSAVGHVGATSLDHAAARRTSAAARIAPR